MTSHPLQQLLDIGQWPTRPLCSVIQPIVCDTLSKSTLFFLHQDNQIAPWPIKLNNLASGLLLLNVLPDGFQLKGCKMSCPRAVEWCASRLQVDLMLDNIGQTQL